VLYQSILEVTLLFDFSIVIKLML